jgi:hypothetical protein
MHLYVVVLRAFSQICPPDCRTPPVQYSFQENLYQHIILIPKEKKLLTIF